MDAPVWPLLPVSYGFRVFGAGEAEQVLGLQSWLRVDVTPDVAGGGCRFQLRWMADDDRLLIRENAEVSASGVLLSSDIEVQGAFSVSLAHDVAVATLSGLRTMAGGSLGKSAALTPGRPLLRQSIWPFLFCFLPWRLGLGFGCRVVDVGYRAADAEVFGLTEAEVSVSESSVDVDMEGGRKTIRTWRVMLAGDGWSGSVEIGQAHEGPLRIDLYAGHTGLLIGRAG